MDKHKIFIAINIPEKIKERFLNYQKKWNDLPVRWVKKGDMHITLVFVGNASSKEMGYICEAVKKEVLNYSFFNINFKKILYFPENKIPPRMIWVLGEGVEELSNLKKSLENALLKEGIHFPIGMKMFKPHITLGRVRVWDWKKIEPDEREDIEEDISMNFEVNSIEVMERDRKSVV